MKDGGGRIIIPFFSLSTILNAMLCPCQVTVWTGLYVPCLPEEGGCVLSLPRLCMDRSISFLPPGRGSPCSVPAMSPYGLVHTFPASQMCSVPAMSLYGPVRMFPYASWKGQAVFCPCPLGLQLVTGSVAPYRLP